MCIRCAGCELIVSGLLADCWWVVSKMEFVADSLLPEVNVTLNSADYLPESQRIRVDISGQVSFTLFCN